ncbi:MAG: cell division protein FtsX [Vicinamibacterales bacterium]
MRALSYFLSEAAESLWRGRRAAMLSILTIAAGLFVLGFFLVVNANLARLVSRWTGTAELAVYLRDDASPAQTAAVKETLASSGLTQSIQSLSKEDARQEFAREFPDLAPAASGLDRNPFPASFEVRLNDRAQSAPAAVDTMSTALGTMPGVADVRYDRRWLARLNTLVNVLRGFALAVVVLLALASALTVANVVRLAALARRDEIEIMQLVGAPFAYIRGPFVLEGILQGGIGAVVSVLLLVASFGVIRAHWGATLSDAVGLGGLVFVPAQLLLLIVIGGMVLGCVGGLLVARLVR